MTTKEQQLASQARKAREAVVRRDALIVELSADGLSLRAIAALAGLSHTAIRKIVDRALNHSQAHPGTASPG